jgi:hypothetical protein
MINIQVSRNIRIVVDGVEATSNNKTYAKVAKYVVEQNPRNPSHVNYERFLANAILDFIRIGKITKDTSEDQSVPGVIY